MKILGYARTLDIITDADAKNLTHVNVGFGDLHTDGSIYVDESRFQDMARVRAANPDIKIVLSIALGDEKDAFTRCAGSEELRRKVGESCADLINRFGLDGVDFDWEYPCVPSNGMETCPEDKYNFTLFLQAVRDAIGENHIVSIAAGADLYYAESVELPKLANILDYICLMTYDLKCGFHALTGHHTALYSSTGDVFRNSCDQALRLFVAYGFPKEKLLLGAGFYSRRWDNIKDRNHGFLQISKAAAGYGPIYDELKELAKGKDGFVRYWDDEAKAPWLFNGSTFLSYDDMESVRYKSEYVKENAYGGIFYWEHSCNANGELIAEIASILK